MLRPNHTATWLLDMLNDCLKHQQIPSVWRKAKVLALLKPGKYPESPKSYRPIALLCSLYKLLERMILTRLQCKIEHKLTPQQAGYRPGKSCCSQVRNLTQHIEDGFELHSSLLHHQPPAAPCYTLYANR